MELRLLLQPFSDEGRVGVALADRAKDATALWILSAWAQESGLKHLRPVIESVHQRQGRAEAVFGVDQGIATYEGLGSALDLFDDVFLFHDGRRTFHPKVYVIESDVRSRVIVGSNNVTEGGLYSNFEAAASIDLDRRDSLDEATRAELRKHYEMFIAEGMPSRRLDRALLEQLRTTGAIGSARVLQRSSEERRRRESPALRKIFGKSATGLPSAPATGTKKSRPARSLRTRPRSGAGTATGGAVVATGAVVASWSKTLTKSDAMRKPAESHQRRYVILGQARHPINKEIYFKRHLFRSASWSRETMHTGKVKEIAVIPFDVFVEGRHVGIRNITVDHAEHRIANQGNAPTYLNWSSLRDLVLKRDYTGWFLVLERYSNGGFRLTLTRSKPGPAVIPAAARV